MRKLLILAFVLPLVSFVTGCGNGGSTSTATKSALTSSPPTVTSLSPSTVAAGGQTFLLTVNGTGFTTQSEVRYNGAARSTTFVNSSQIKGTILGSDIAATGTGTITVREVSTGAVSNSMALTVSQSASPTISTSSVPAGTQGSTYSAGISVTGGTAPFFFRVASGALPPGLFLDSTTGAISGNPTTPGNYTFVIEVRDANNVTAQSPSITMNIAQSSGAGTHPLAITTTQVPNGTVQLGYTATLTATGGTTPYNWSLSSGSLPAGLVLNATGDIVGTPSQTGSSSFLARVTDSASASQTVSLTISIGSGPLTVTTTNPLPSGSVGTQYSTQLIAQGGLAPLTWSVVGGSLPNGLSLAADGTISGVPTTAGTSSVTVQVHDAGLQLRTVTYSITIGAQALVLQPPVLPGGGVGVPYTAVMNATGGTLPYTWNVASGALPPGLTLGAATGAITGAPSSPGTFTFTVRVVDSNAQTRTSSSLSISVAAAPLVIQTASLPNGAVGSAYSGSLTANGGTQPYAWSILTGALPPGISLNATTGALTGTPTAAGNFTVVVQVADGGAQSQRVTLTIAVSAPGLIVSTTSLAGGAVGVVYSTQLVAAGGTPPYNWALTSGNLPAGLALNAVTGGIGGTPTTIGTSAFTVRVSDSASQTATGSLTITIAPAALNITTSSLLGGTVGTSYSATLAATGGSAPFSWSVIAGTLPAGVVLNAATGGLSGTPTAAGTATATFQVQDASTQQRTVTLAISITPAPLVATTTSLAGGTAGTAYSASLAASGGTTPYTWTVSTGALPAGVSLSPTGTLSGTPTTPGTSSFVAQVRDAANLTALTASLSITIAPAPLTITTTTLPGGGSGSNYLAALAATGGTGSYTWTIASGTLPTGLNLAASGSISGTPSVAGTSNFTLRVTDQGTPTAQTTTRAFSITITAAAQPVFVTSVALPGGTVGTAYATTLLASGGTAPYTWALTSGTLPAGLTLNTSTGDITGTPTAAGTANITARVTDGSAGSASVNLSIVIVPAPLVITTISLPAGQVGAAYTTVVAASGGTAPYTWTIAAGSLPNGLALATNGSVTGVPTVPGATSVGIRVTDAAAQQTVTTLNITIAPAAVTITTINLGPGSVGSPYSATVAAAGGTVPYTFTISGGALPAGLSMSTSGAISGTPSTGGTSSFTVRVADSATTQQFATANLNITVIASGLTIATNALPSGAIGVAYNFVLSSSGGTTPRTWTVLSGALPGGLSLASNGTISGTPTASGTFTVGLRVADNSTPVQTQSVTLPITISPAPLRIAGASVTTLPPVVFFTDLDSGPKTGGEHNNGVYVTIFGRNFGATRGTSTVTIGGGQVVNYVSWCQACSNAQLGPASPDKMDVIVVELGAAVASGEVKVTVGGVSSSNGPQFTVRSGNIDCVSASGLDTASHGTFSAGCWKTVIFARDNIAAGDTVYIRGNVTTNGSDTTQNAGFCATLVIGSFAGGSGSPGSPKALVGYPGEMPTIGDTSGGQPTATTGCYLENPPGQPILSIQRSNNVTAVQVATTPTNFGGALRGVKVGTWVQITSTTNYNRILQIASVTPTCIDADHCALNRFTLTDPGANLAAEASGNIQVKQLYINGIKSKGGSDYWTFANLNARGTQAAMDWSGAGGRIVNVDMSAPGGDFEAATLDGTTINGIKVYGIRIHDSGISRESTVKFFHQVYWSNGDNRGIDMGWFEIGGNNWGCHGIQGNGQSHGADVDWAFHDGYIHDNRCSAVDFASMDPSQGPAKFYNMIVQRAGMGPTPVDGGGVYACIEANNIAAATTPGASGAIQTFNNTLIDCGRETLGGSNSRGAIDNGNARPAISIDVRDTVIVNTSGEKYVDGLGVVTGSFSNCTGGTNGVTGACPLTWTSTISLDPQLQDNTGYSDLHLTSSTPAAIVTSGFNAAVSFDHDGLPRPQGTTNSMGAYELIPSGATSTTATLPNTSIGSTYSVTLAANGGTAPFTWSLLSGSLPPGITLSTSGVLSGIPSIAGTYSFALRVVDATGQAQQSGVLSIQVLPPTLAIATSFLPNAQLNALYSTTLTATGGTSPYTWTALTALPGGLSLGANNGVLSGTPNVTGFFTLQFKVTDAVGASVTSTLGLSVQSSLLRITTTSLPTGIVGANYATSLVAAGGAPPYTWTIVLGALPPGLSLNGTTGAITGVPTTTGGFNFTVQARDSAAQAQQSTVLAIPITVSVASPPPLLTINTTSLPGATTGAAYNASLSASGGTPPYTWSIGAGSLPPGVNLSSGGILTGTPTASGIFTANYQVNDGSPTTPQAATRTMTISVGPQPSSTPSQFQSLIVCQRNGATDNCTTLNSPPDLNPPLFDGTAATIYTDPVFSTRIRRISIPQTLIGQVGVGLVPAHSSVQAWNADGSKLMLSAATGTIHIFSGTAYTLFRSVANNNGSTANPGVSYDSESAFKWDNGDPDVIWYTSGCKLLQYHVGTDRSTLVKDFCPLTIDGIAMTNNKLRMGDNCDFSSNNNRVAFRIVAPGAGNIIGVAAYDIGTDSILGAMNFQQGGDTQVPGSPQGGVPAAVCMSPSGNNIVIDWNLSLAQSPTFHGYQVFNNNFTGKRQAGNGDHSGTLDVGFLGDGSEAFVAQINQAVPDDDRTLNAVRFNDLSMVNSVRPNGSFNGGAMSASMRCQQLRGWAIMSSFTSPPNGSNPDPSAAQPMQDEIFAAKLDGSNEFRRIAHHQSIVTDSFAEPHATPNRDCTKIVFGSTWRTSAGANPDSHFAYVIELP